MALVLSLQVPDVDRDQALFPEGNLREANPGWKLSLIVQTWLHSAFWPGDKPGAGYLPSRDMTFK